MDILKINGLSVNFGGLWALRDVDITVQKGGIASVIGPNGAGKTTLFNVISGVYKPAGGEIMLDNQQIDGLKPFQISNKGIARTFQNIRLFNSLSVEENLLIPFASKMGWGSTFRFSKMLSRTDRENEILDTVSAVLKDFGLEKLQAQKAMDLSHGHQRKLELARAMVLTPKLILLDEPSAGLSIEEIKEILSIIKSIQEKGTAILLIEHNMSVVMNISDKICVLNYGIKIAEGTPMEISQNSKVIAAYLGED